MAGPWFTVVRDNYEWHELSDIWVSNGSSDLKGRIELRLELVDPATSHWTNHPRSATAVEGE